MLLSIIIVNYNVKYFLEQCLCSVSKALASAGIANTSEVWVVDNNSPDESVDYLQPRFPFVRFIANKENVGFARANNQALEFISGKYVLYLNPDTILPEDVFEKLIAFMGSHPDAGAVGIRMIDGSGRFLKESKRGLPTLWASFCKMTGLTAAFPRSRTFSRYYLGHLDDNKTQQADVLAGAFMLVPKAVLDKTGAFDERFFMYAEDIDLSYRILQAGYHNYYFADATIIHFKGESTRKDARYVKLFYKAMRQFVQKHYRSGRGRIFSGFLTLAINLRSGIAALRPARKASNKAENLQPRLAGDQAVAGWLRQHLANQQLVVNDRSNAVLFCVGGTYSFKQLIEDMQQLRRGDKALVHADGSSSVVGSFDKDAQGVGFGI